MKWNERRKILHEVKSFIKQLDLNQDEVCYTGSTITGMPDAMEVLAREDYRLAVVVLSSPKVVEESVDVIGDLTCRVERLEEWLAQGEIPPKFVLTKESK